MANEVDAKVKVFPYDCARCKDEQGMMGVGYILDVHKSLVRVAWDEGGIQMVNRESIKPAGAMEK